jgi:phosphoribosyl-ATP pyrophosphohydrolase
MAKSEKKKAAVRRPKVAGNGSTKMLPKTAGKSKKSAAAAKFAVSPEGPGAVVLDRLFAVIENRRQADPTISHSARLLSRGRAKVAQKFGEEAVECLIEAVAGNRDALIAESADVLYHLLVLWVSSGVEPAEVWGELTRREGISGIAEKAARANPVLIGRGAKTSKIP